MNKKGFTLIELLGIIIILGVISLIAIPSINSLIGMHEERLYKVQIDSIKGSLKTWGDANARFLPTDGNFLTINLGIVKLSGFANDDIENPLDETTCFPNELPLTIKNVGGSYQYIVEESAMDRLSTSCVGAPLRTDYLLLQGSSSIELSIGSTYTDPGYLILDENGMGVRATATTSITKGGTAVSSISTSSAGTYTVTYTYKELSVTRTVSVN